MQRAADRPVLGKPPPRRAPAETGGSARPFMAKRWIQVAPLGEFPHTAGGVERVIDADAVRAMAESFDASRTLLVDFDHYSDLSNAQREAVERAGVALPTKAAGWIEAVEARGDGLYALADLNRAGERAIENADYRFVSPVWLRGDCEDAGPGKVRPRKLYKVGLTNEPNIRALPPLQNRDGAEPMAGPLVLLANGDEPGHPFRGNQHTDGASGGGEPEKARPVSRRPRRTRFWRRASRRRRRTESGSGLERG